MKLPAHLTALQACHSYGKPPNITGLFKMYFGMNLSIQMNERQQEPLLLTEISLTSSGIRACISNYIHVKQGDVIIYTCPKLNAV